MLLLEKVEKIRNQILNDDKSLYSYLSNSEQNKYLLNNIDDKKLDIVREVVDLWKRELNPNYIINYKYYVYKLQSSICVELFLQIEDSTTIMKYKIIISPDDVRVIESND